MDCGRRWCDGQLDTADVPGRVRGYAELQRVNRRIGQHDRGLDRRVLRCVVVVVGAALKSELVPERVAIEGHVGRAALVWRVDALAVTIRPGERKQDERGGLVVGEADL